MSEAEGLGPAKSVNAQNAVRKIFHKHFRKLTKVLLTRNCHGVIEHQIEALIFTLEFLKREARRKVPSKKYKQFCHNLLAQAAAGQIGPLASLPPERHGTLHTILDVIVRGFAGKPPARIDPAEFISLQKKLFRTDKRGPKFLSKYDKAYLLSGKSETVTQIARKFDPEKFQIDPVNTIQKYWRAIERRKRLALLR